MANKTINNFKLGIFVFAGLMVLVGFLYFIGKKRNMFGSTYMLKAHFRNVQGLVPGNNVRFVGMQAGTVSNLQVEADTAVLVEMLIYSSFKNVIKSNAVVSIATDGIVGNKVLNIVPGKTQAETATPGTVLQSKEAYSTEDVMNMLGGANDDLTAIMSQLRMTVERFNNSKGFWNLMNSESIATDLKGTLNNLQLASERINNMSGVVNEIMVDLKGGKGSAGRILRDTLLVFQLEEAARRLNNAGAETGKVIEKLDNVVSDIEIKMKDGGGPVPAALNDKEMTISIRQSLDNIEKGTRAFEQNMEALKHNFLFRGYFKKLEKQERKQQKD